MHTLRQARLPLCHVLPQFTFHAAIAKHEAIPQHKQVRARPMSATTPVAPLPPARHEVQVHDGNDAQRQGCG